MNRREFAKHIAQLSASLGLVLSSNGRADLTNTAGRRLILVELAGANDGLNTLVPFTNDHYYQLRPSLALSATDVLMLDDDMGLHPALEPLMPVWQAGELAWLQGLGYPQPNRSHFKSIALWETAGDGHRRSSTQGWMTHAIEHRMARKIRDPHGISLFDDLSIFASEGGRWLAVQSVKDLLEQSVPRVRGKIVDHEAMALLQSRLRVLNSTLSNVSTKLAGGVTLGKFQGGVLGEQLRQVVTMIQAGLDTPVYRVRLAGFDTHKNQSGRHQRLLKTLAQALSHTRNQLISMNEWDNTFIMSYSEFGRRAAENRSGGTDHGTAAPHILMGGSVHGGLWGNAPDLAHLEQGDPAFTMDYRAVYHQILTDALAVSDAENDDNSLSKYRDARLQRLIKVA